MKTLLIDPVGGAAGDMLLALLLDLGLDQDSLTRELRKLPLEGWSLEVAQGRRMGITGLGVQIHLSMDQPARHWAEIDRMLSESSLSEKVQQRARSIFHRLAEVEGKIHDQPPETVHFHEVGAVDSILDIVGVCIGLEHLQIDQVICAPLPLGRGQADTCHGPLPLPAPATLELLRDTPVTWTERQDETVTPTGAVLLKEIATFSAFPDTQIEKIGYGLGQRDPQSYANLIRGMLCHSLPAMACDQVSVLEAHVDDASPEWLGALLEDLLDEGALDAGFSPLQMKKNRPGVRITVLCEPAQADRLSHWLLIHSSTAGVRRSTCRRDKLTSQLETVETPIGPIQVKHFYDGETYIRSTPEYDDCRRLSRALKQPLPDIYRQAIQAIESKGTTPR